MPKYKRNIIILVILSGLVIYFSLKDDFSAVISQVSKTEITFLIIACLILILNWLIRGLMMRMMIRKFKPDYTYKQAVRLVVLTNLFNSITPFGTGGEPAQVYFINKDGLDIPTATTVVLQKLIVFQITLLLFGITSISLNYFLHIFEKVIILRNLVIIGFSLNTILLIFTFLLSSNKKMNKNISKFILNLIFFRKTEKEKKIKLDEWNTYLDNFHKGATTLRSNKKDFIKVLALSILEVSFHYIIPIFLVRAVVGYFPMGIIETLVATNYVILSSGFIPIPGASGGREYSFIAFYGTFIGGSALTAVMLLWRFITYYFPIFTGAITLILYRKKETR